MTWPEALHDSVVWVCVTFIVWRVGAFLTHQDRSWM